MRYRKLDTAGDYTLGTGSDFYVNTPAAVAQAVQTRLLLLAGEWFLDTADGTPWRTDVLGKYTQQAYDAVLKDRILSTPGVTEITQYSSFFDRTRRLLTVAVTIGTLYGPTTFTTEL